MVSPATRCCGGMKVFVRRRFQGLVVQRKAEGMEKENHRGHRGHAKKANHREHGEKQTTEDTEVGKEGPETLVRTLGKVRLQGERRVRRARKKQTTARQGRNLTRRRKTTEDTEDTEKKTQRERAATNSPWIKPRLDGAAIDDGNAADAPSGPWASGVQPPADRGLPCT